jgi:hypothetical protein
MPAPCPRVSNQVRGERGLTLLKLQQACQAQLCAAILSLSSHTRRGAARPLLQHQWRPYTTTALLGYGLTPVGRMSPRASTCVLALCCLSLPRTTSNCSDEFPLLVGPEDVQGYMIRSHVP